MTLKRRVYSIINYTKFAYFLCKGIFGSSSPEVILRIIGKFVSLEAPYYSNKIVMGRSPQKSAQLLQSLINTYITTKSEIVLNQALEVLKEEILKRENKKNGRKQF